MTNNNELYHYGVIGMKWGLHRGHRNEVLSKAYTKYNKLLSRGDKYKHKAAKFMYKSSKLKMRGKMAKALKYEGKANKLTYKASKKARKANRWAAKVLKVAYGEKVTRFEKYSGDAARRFLKKYDK